MNDLSIPPYFTISACELITQVSTSSGAGGQHVNKTSTKVTLKWNIEASTSIKEAHKERLLHKLANKINKKKERMMRGKYDPNQPKQDYSDPNYHPHGHHKCTSDDQVFKEKVFKQAHA